MIINKQTIKGKLGETVIYSFIVEEGENKIIIKNLSFSSPIGEIRTKDDIVVDLVREELDKIVEVSVFVDDREYTIEIEEIYVGAKREDKIIGLEGDIILVAYIPKISAAEEVLVSYKEVIDKEVIDENKT